MRLIGESGGELSAPATPETGNKAVEEEEEEELVLGNDPGANIGVETDKYLSTVAICNFLQETRFGTQ